jgi:hypothetical protein
MTAPAKGTGTSPFGTAAYGYGTPPIAPTPGGSVNRDARGIQQNSVALLAPVSPGSNSYAMTSTSPKLQYVYDEFGRRVGAPDTVQMILLALGTIKGTSVDATLGQTFGDVRKVTDAFHVDMKARVEDALSDVVAAKLVTIDSITTTPGNGAPARINVQLTDLASNQTLNLSI